MAADSDTSNIRRLTFYAIESVRRQVDDYVLFALRALREFAHQLVVLAPANTSAEQIARLSELADSVFVMEGELFTPREYHRALVDIGQAVAGYDEIVLTGDGWFGPIGDLGVVLDRMSRSTADVWEMIGAVDPPPPGFPGEGFPAVTTPWRWTAIRRSLFESSDWREYWQDESEGEAARSREVDFLRHFATRGYATKAAFPEGDYPSGDPGLYDTALLLMDGCPFVPRLLFRLYPPFLDQRALLGREVLMAMDEAGYPASLALSNLVRVVPARALNATLGMVSVLAEIAPQGPPLAPEILAVMHVSDFEGVEELLGRLANLPPYDLVITTTDGLRAARLQAMVDGRRDRHRRSVEVRVTPDDPGRDMSDLFVGCRDLLLSGRYELFVKVHSRGAPTKTLNRLRYFRRYQWENLLGSKGYVQNLLALFDTEPGLGIVFPPAMHVGYSLMGRAWAGLEAQSKRVARMLRVGVPLDQVSPLAPFGGMWIARPEAIRRMSAHRWRYGDYRGRSRLRELAHVQERLIVSAAAEDGYHARTVMNREHAGISHTALEFKLDEMSTATRGYPLDQITFVHRAGWMGQGSIVSLTRMYLRLNHFGVARTLLPLYRFATLMHRAFSNARRFAERTRNSFEKEDES